MRRHPADKKRSGLSGEQGFSKQVVPWAGTVGPACSSSTRFGHHSNPFYVAPKIAGKPSARALDRRGSGVSPA